MKRSLLFLCLLGCAISLRAETLYQENFESIAIGDEPADFNVFMVLDGRFTVQEFEGDKVFELPGAPLDNFGFIFGPVKQDNLSVSARVNGSRQGRRFPMFAVGANGIGGFKLRVAPMKRVIELVNGDETVASQSWSWQSGAWTHLKLEVTQLNEGTWRVAGKVWQGDGGEPEEWNLKHEVNEEPIQGKCSAWGAPFSGEPIRFDDLKVESVEAAQ